MCGSIFLVKSSLTKHVNTYKRETIFSLLGLICIFTAIPITKTHVNTHCREIFPCQLSKSAFSNKFSSAKHMQIHTGEKPFSCQMCESSFSLKSNLQISS